MEALRRKERGFTYRVSFGHDGKPDGIVWMTPTMRAAFENFGWVVCLDAMKRQRWPSRLRRKQESHRYSRSVYQ
ncbi:MAG: hypothetical protein ACREOZ_01070 [Gloeomargaritales cyanobacterium]